MNSDIDKIRLQLHSNPNCQPLQMALAKLLMEDAWANYAHDKWIKSLAEAQLIYESVLTANPGNLIAIVNLGAVLSDQGLHLQAMEKYSLAQERGWQDANLDFNIGVALLNLREAGRGCEFLRASQSKIHHEGTLQAYFDPQAH